MQRRLLGEKSSGEDYSNWGILPRSSVVNEAIGYFLNTANPKDLRSCKKRKVNLLIDREKLDKLNKYAKSYGVNRGGIIRFAIRNVIPRFAKSSKAFGHRGKPRIPGGEEESGLT
jgi:hypothetical protein